MTTPRWNRTPRIRLPEKYRGAAPLDYVGFAFCTLVFIWFALEWIGLVGMTPGRFILLSALCVSFGVSAHSRQISSDRWTTERMQSDAFARASKIGAVLVLLLGAIVVSWSVIEVRTITLAHLMLAAACVAYADLLHRFGPLIPLPRWKVGPLA